MNILKLAAAACAALALSTTASAAVLVGASGSSNAVTDYSTAGLVSFNLDLKNFSGSKLSFMLQEEDLLAPLSLSAMILNLSGSPISQFNFGLKGISFASAGSVTPGFGTLDKVSYGSNNAGIGFASAEPAEFHFGNPLGLSGQSDWILNTAGLKAGDTFTITAQVPEPSTVALVLPMLCMAGLMAARRRKQD
ncbi:PEP-CTERM sorting domain-containing protein [Massilia niastensis]|uniref:PEP-CTERM sorting domain-containing protein n=1 Tax=Massilia niastensis TaxID=544911 RepID=UPI00035C3F95|nr:PEP-CTERM sorting domain-containing protein [Massilia niastensis]